MWTAGQGNGSTDLPDTQTIDFKGEEWNNEQAMCRLKFTGLLASPITHDGYIYYMKLKVR